jgi:putative transposase
MSDTFIHEIPLKTTPHDEAVLDVRLDAARNLYNACLRESLRRLDLMRESKAYRAARVLPKGKARNAVFKTVRGFHGFQEYGLHVFAAKTCKACWLGDHLDAFTIQKVATRAFGAVEQHAYGGRGRPRFKRKGWLTSVEGKSNAAGIRWRDDHVLWSGLKLAALFDIKDKHDVEAHALSCRVKYLRLVKRVIKGNNCWFVQLILEGTAHQKEKNIIAEGTCGLDIGPSTIAAVGEADALLTRFCDEVVQPWKEIKREQRAQDRSRRATNPDNYNDDGTVKQGSRQWHRSNRYKKRQEQIAACQRALAATRKKQHGELCHKVLSLGKVIKTEKLSYKSFQKNYGQSVAIRAPGMFIVQLTRKAANAGGGVEDINTRRTKLSQTCICGNVEKKPIKQRHHACACGIEAQRDLFSAFLAKHCSHHTLDICRAKAAWPAAEPLLRRAMSRITETASRGPVPASFGLSRRQSCSPVKDGSTAIKVADAVARKSESHKEMPVLPLEPPAFSHGEVQQHPETSVPPPLALTPLGDAASGGKKFEITGRSDGSPELDPVAGAWVGVWGVKL